MYELRTYYVPSAMLDILDLIYSQDYYTMYPS